MGKKFFDFRHVRKWAFLLLSAWAGQSQAGITITEVMQSNFGGVLDYYNEFPDSWVEIYNSGEKDVDLNGFSIGELNDLDSAYVIPESFVVPADGYFLIYCDKENIKQHTHFRLNSDKPGALYLWDDQGVLLDSMHYPEMISPEVSWGRLPDNPDSLSHFRIATPEQRNNNTNTERVMKKVDFSVDGGVKKEPFYLNLTLKGDYPEDAVIRYTTDGSEPTSKSQIFFDSLYLYIQKNTVVRAKPFSDSAISKISKTQTYIFDRDDKMPIISVVGDYSHLYGFALGIFSSYTAYGDSHPDNPSPRSWMGNQNYLYNWRRPINIEYFSSDSLTPNFNQLSETRVTGNVSREYTPKSMVVYANKRFGDKHFNGVFWKNLKPNCKKQKSMTIRTSSDNLYSINDMLSQTSIGRFAKYYDLDYQAKCNVQLYINGEFKRIMHLQERDGDDFVWANHNKITDIEIIETDNGLGTDRVNEGQFPNYAHFMDTYRSRKSTYQQMTELLDVNAFMNFVSTQAYFANVDFPYNNAAAWFDKQGSKKWRWIMKDMDATFHDPNYNYYNFILRKEPFEEFSWANTPAACEVYQKMFSFEKFKQPYIDRTSVLAGTAFSKNTLTFMLDSIIGDMSLALSSDDLKRYVEDLEWYYEWSDARHGYYYYDLSQFFGLGDTAKLTIRSKQSDSLIYFNNNPLIENKYDGYFFEERDLFLTHNNKLDIYGLDIPNTNEISYMDFGEMVKTEDSISTRWTISYYLDGQHIYEHYSNKDLHYKIPIGAENVYISDGYVDDGMTSSEPVVTSRLSEDLTYMVYNISGMVIGKFSFAELCDYKQNEDINIVVVLDSLGSKLYSFKLLKEK